MAKRVFIGVGHGGNDPGAVANGLKEAYINLTVALEVDAILKAHNVVVMLSRYREENDDLAEEIRECNAFGADLAVDIHVNAGGGDGFEVFHTKNGGTGKVLAQNIETEVKAIGQNSRGLKTKLNSAGNDYFGFIRSISCPSIIVEMAFIDNINDIKDFDEAHEQKRYALAVARGILKTLGIAYKGEGQAPAPTPTPSTPVPTPAPSTGKDKEVRRYAENGKCTITTPSGIRFRDKPSTDNGVVQGTYSKGESVYYDLVVISEKYVWISWVSASKKVRRYMPVKDRSTGDRWGTCV